MTCREKAIRDIEVYCQKNNIVLSSDEYEEMLYDVYCRYMDELLGNPPKSKRKDGLR